MSSLNVFTRIGGRSYSSTTDNLLYFCTNKTEHYLQTSSQTFYFSFAIDSREILASVWQEEENFEVLKR